MPHSRSAGVCPASLNTLTQPNAGYNILLFLIYVIW